MAWFGVRTGIYRYLPGLTRVSVPIIDRTLERLPPDALIADIGAGGRRITPYTLTVDRFTIKNTDIVADIHKLPLPECSVDAVFCTGTPKAASGIFFVGIKN